MSNKWQSTFHMEQAYAYKMLHVQSRECSRTTKLDYCIKITDIKGLRGFAVCVVSEIANFLIGCIYRREYVERIKRLQGSDIKGFSITVKCTNVTEALHVYASNQRIHLCKI